MIAQRNDRAPRPASIVRGHQPDQVSVRAIAAWSIVLAVVLLGVSLALVQLGELFARARPAAAAPSLAAPEVVALQAQRASLEREAEANLEAYRWVDRAAGIAQIPIERAMQLIIENGLPQFATPASAPSTGPSSGGGAP